MSSAAHRLELANSVANDAIRGVEMQHYRVLTELPEDKQFFAAAGYRREVDLQLFLVLLIRLRRAVGLGARLLDESDLDVALEEFDSRVPTARRMRNVSEHVDEYIDVIRSEESKVPGGALGIRIWGDASDGDLTFAWAGMTVDLHELRQAALDLYRAFRVAIEASHKELASIKSRSRLNSDSRPR